MPSPPKAKGKLCGAVKTDGSGDTCTKPAGWGTDHVGYGHCKFHFGNTRAHVESAKREQAKDIAHTYGLPIEVDAMTAILEELYRSQGHVLWLEDKVAHLGPDQLKQKDMSGKFERPAVWVEMLWTERKHLAGVAKAILDAKIDERQARVNEVQAATLAALVMGLFNDPSLNLTQEQIEIGKQLAAHRMRELASAG